MAQSGETRGEAITTELRGHLPGLDALRAVAAFAVVLFHYNAEAFPEAPVPSDLFFRGYLGVELFFTISGFVILMSLGRTRSVSEFAIGRIARLVPAYWFSFLLGTLYVAIGLNYAGTSATPDRFSDGFFLANALLVPEPFGFKPLLAPYWTLALEIIFYCVIAATLAARAIPKLPALSLLWLVAATLIRTRFHTIDGDMTSEWLSLRYGEFFIAGMMAYRVVSRRGTPLTWCALLSAVWFAWHFGRDNAWSWTPGWAYGPFAALCVASLVLSTRPFAEKLVPAWLVEIGRASYSLYLLHLIVGWTCVAAFGALGLPRAVAYVFALPTAIAVSMLSYRWVERPGATAIKRAVRGRLSRVRPAGQG